MSIFRTTFKFVLGVAFLLSIAASPTKAEMITFTLQGTGSGTLVNNGVSNSFSNAPFSFSVVTDTTLINTSGGNGPGQLWYFTPFVSGNTGGTVSIDGVTGTWANGVSVDNYVYTPSPSSSSLSFAQQNSPSSYFFFTFGYNSSLLNYDLQSPIGPLPLSNPNVNGYNYPVTTSFGSFTLTSISSATFTATTQQTQLAAGFTATPTSGPAPLTVTFTDTSTGSPTAWSWSFGDGVTSTNQNPTHIYTTAGTYTVTLTVSNSMGSNSTSQTIVVTNPLPVDGVCGSSNLSTCTSAPTTNLCSSGTPTAVTGTGPWYWNCLGANDGANASCSATPPPTVPGAPTGVNATAGNAQATVSFTAPASDGYSAITGYSVTSKPAGGVDLNAGTTSTTHTIDGLTNGKAYTFTVTATNSVGTGPPSSPSNTVKPSTKIAQKPSVTIIGPKPNTTVPGDSVTINGTASDKNGIASVWWCVNGGIWQQASGTTKWTATVQVIPAANTIEVYSQDPAGNVSAIASVSVVSLANLVSYYWPMNDGDEKNYTGVLGPATMSFAATGPQSFSMTVTPVDSNGDSGILDYELDPNDNLLLDDESVLGYTMYFEPPLIELTATLLAKGGSLKSSTTGTIEGINVPTTQTVSVKNAGAVTVPAGTFSNCVTCTQAVTAKVPGYASVSASAQVYVLAPGVGAIKMGVAKLSGVSFSLVGWENLVSGTVNGVPIGDPASAAVNKSEHQSEAKLANLIKMDDQTLPEFQVEAPLAKLEFTRYDDGQSQLVLKGGSGNSYLLEAGAPDENGNLVWKSLWEGVLTKDSLSMPVPEPVAGTVYRVREP